MSFQFTDFFNEFFFFEQNYFFIANSNYISFLDLFSYSTFVDNINNLNLHTKSIINFINQTEDINLYNNVENVTSLYHYSIPNVKLAYPEPFVASPSFMHSDLWFIHILVYQYWLWFVFVFIIVFFFITFICTVRWCNMRIRPRRETRGISRSKCGDLITAIVPVTWATSIIVNESTDAIDYYDGFGTTELVVGIRAYQWGWEYYYPKDLDLNYNIKSNYSAFIGNSLKYEKTSELNLKTNNVWKFYQNKSFDSVITPAHLLALPLDNYKLLNFLNFNDLGANSVYESNAFKKVRMFSKFFAHNLVLTNNSYSNKYKILSNLYVNDNFFSDSYLYGIKRQHNLLSVSSTLNNYSTFINLNSLNKIITFNFNNEIKFNTKSNQIGFNNFLKKNSNIFLNDSSLKINNFFNKFHNTSDFQFFLNSSLYNKFLLLINDNSDKKKIKFPFFKFFNLKLKKNFFHNFINLNNLNDNNDISYIENNNELMSFFPNTNVTYKSITSFSPNQYTQITNRFIRNFVKIPLMVSNYNYSSQINPLNSYLNISNKNIGFNSKLTTTISNSKWLDPLTTSKLGTTKLNTEYPYSPFFSNNPNLKTIDFDKLQNSLMDNIPTILQGKEELVSAALTNIYWNFYWNMSTLDWRLYNDQIYHSIHKSFYLPMFSFYYDYDFRNWQSLELLEDSFWESIYSVYTHDEYMSLTDDFYDYNYFDKVINIYNKIDRFIIFQDRVANQPFFRDTNSFINNNYYFANSLFLDDFISQSNLIVTKDFSIFPIFSGINHIEESYSSLKHLNYFFNLSNKILLNLSNNCFQPISHLLFFDYFRSDIDEFSWFVDDNAIFKNYFITYDFLNKKNVNAWNTLNIKNCLDFFNDKKTYPSFYWYLKNSSNIMDFEIENNLNKLNKFSNALNLRSPAKNAIVTYNSIQKVFRARFDENRSNSKLQDFGYSYSKQPMITSSKIQYDKVLGKTKENFFKINFYKNEFQSFFNNLYEANSGLNFYFFDFPFLLALKSDASRYLWFDWFAKWGFYEIQPSSSSRYAIHGMPYFSKNFEFGSTDGEALNETETYFLRISRARRNYMPNWTYSPYFYAKNIFWYRNNIMFEIMENSDNTLNETFNLLNNMDWNWKKIYFIKNLNYQFFPSHSGINNYAKLGWKPQHSIQSYYYSLSNLIDILTKREFLYRELFSVNNKIVNLPLFLTNSSSNPLINEIKSSFFFVDPIMYNNEYSRDVYFSSLNFFNFLVIKSFLENFNNILNLNLISDFIFYYFLDSSNINLLQNNTELYKNQYRPMKKGINNMIRLHATGAIAMPIEIRLQILASSKDVIHSWAIPSAGIKIDCVPGYSSHKVIIFLVSGIFWGQCMEICGRYHHWMPIIIYFMKRDLFFLWCTHFVFLTGSNNLWNINDRQFVDYIRLVSFDKYSWLSEINS